MRLFIMYQKSKRLKKPIEIGEVVINGRTNDGNKICAIIGKKGIVATMDIVTSVNFYSGGFSLVGWTEEAGGDKKYFSCWNLTYE